MERLDKILSAMGICSRREASVAAKSGKITINSTIVKKSDVKIDPNKDEIIFCGEKIEYQKNIYIMLNKKAGYITATEDKKHQTVLDLLSEREQKMGLFAAGRLDKDTEGLLLLTNDGEFSHKIMSPKNHIEKVYFARVEGRISSDAQQEFEQGIELGDGYKCMPAKIEVLKNDEISEVLVTICEGKFHQVKRMLWKVGGEVIYLKRLSIGTIKLDENLEVGQYRQLSEQEIAGLKVILS